MGVERRFETIVRDGVLAFRRPATEWLSSGWNGGRRWADAAYNVSVPDPWEPPSLDAYVGDRLETAGFERDLGDSSRPTLLTGVDLAHARGARCGSVTVVATAGITNPAALPMDPGDGSLPPDDDHHAGTVNLLIGTTRALASGALANLLTVAAEAKAATLVAETGFPGTTTDAIVVGHDPDGPATTFSGSATPVGAATRACVREAVRASLDSWVTDSGTIPDTVDSASYGMSTDVRADVFRPDE